MKRLVAFLLLFVLLVLPVSRKVYAEGATIDDLLNPEVSSMNNRANNSQELTSDPNEGRNIDDLLGPKDNFPFLPDNHRDSGTGKFNSF